MDPATVNDLADRLARLIAGEAATVEPELLRRALLTLVARLAPAPPQHQCKRIPRTMAR
jgi:hypothetical protein